MDTRIEDFMDDELESEVLEMFTYSCVDKIKEGPKVSMNQKDEEVQASITKKNGNDTLKVGNTRKIPNTEKPTLGINVSCCMTHMS